ncbi:pilus assembly protein N-terminal domain-containing protein [Microvirga vignae]|uniref:pilus assembly protein N-terminal domain-containing protein n=1 Tax=Microvirga vignae TaxID=1225564 RepID=UPI00069C92E5|nr:pilus assembly protein N-terminal domain-containing protein [Microvirga vignae]
MLFRAIAIFALSSTVLAADLSQAPAVLADQSQIAEVETDSGGTITMAPGITNILRITRPVRTVLIGNPGVLDTTLVDDKTLALTAKAAGTTNLILLDENNAELLQATVQVGPRAHRIQAFYGDQMQTYSCTPECIGDPRPVPTSQYTTTYETRDAQGNVVNTTRSSTNVAPPPPGMPPVSPPAPGVPVR